MNAYDRAVLESLPYYEQLEAKARAEFAKEKTQAWYARERKRHRAKRARQRLETESAGLPKHPKMDRRCAAHGCRSKATTRQGLCPRCMDRLRYEAIRLKEGRSIETEERREEAA